MLGVHDLVERISKAASYEKDDARSVELARVANRLAHQGTICEKPLTKQEIALINQFLPQVKLINN